LFSAGYEIAEAHDRAGLDRAMQESSPSLLLIGEKLGGESGIQLSLKQLERFPTLPILMYAEKDSASIAKEVLRAGLSGYIFPPLRTDDIVTAVTRSLERARNIGDWVRREITRTTASLQRQVNDFDAIFNNIGDGVLILDKHGRIILLNRVACQIFGVTTEAMLGKPVAQAISHPDLQSLLNRSTDQEMKYHEINFHDGRVFNARYTPIPNVGSAITIQDISYLKELDRVKNDFIHTVSHDLRSPLTSVLGYAELIGRTGPLNEHQRDFMARLQASIQNITALVNDLLDLGRLEAGFDTRREIVQLENILAYTLDVLQGQINARNLELMIRRLAGHPLAEARQLAGELAALASEVAPSLLRYTKPQPKERQVTQALKTLAADLLPARGEQPTFSDGDTVRLVEVTPQGDAVLVAALLHGASQASWDDCFNRARGLDPLRQRQVILRALEPLSPHESPPRAFELISTRWDLVVSASCFAQLKRHRMATLLTQPYDPALGYTLPDAVARVGMVQHFERVMTESTLLFYELLQEHPAVAPYALTQAHRRRLLLQINGRELYHFSRLRQDRHAQWDIRRLADRMLEQARAELPLSLLLACGKDTFSRQRELVFNSPGPRPGA